MRYLKNILFYTLLIFNSCVVQSSEKEDVKIKTGAEQTEKYLPLLLNKNVAIVANHSTVIKKSHLVDSLLGLGVKVVKIFSPEHGFRGKADAGEFVKNHLDEKTGLPVISLYGSNKKPDENDLEGIEIVVFDLQDVGVRFYTYISTMHYVMEACAEKNIEVLILDRPNPNGFFVDGPVLDTAYKSFVGMHPVPVVHGMTIAEYAQMINNEGWLKKHMRCKLKYIPCKNYTHDSLYKLPLNPSPNLQNMLSIYLYPSLGFFEGTSISVGRGTDFPFQVFGSPAFKDAEFTFSPREIDGASKNPKYKGEKCFGIDLRNIELENLKAQKRINLEWLIFAYENVTDKKEFFNSFFYNITGTKKLKDEIVEGKTADQIRDGWHEELEKFKVIRKKYLIYKDFE